jgi:hypothetical protein
LPFGFLSHLRAVGESLLCPLSLTRARARLADTFDLHQRIGAQERSARSACPQAWTR